MNKKITVKPAESDGVKIMYVDHPVFKEKAKKTFHFKNELEGTQPGEIKFYYLTDKGGSALPEFCQQMDSGSEVLEFKPGNATTPCTLSDGTTAGYYAYTVEYPGYKDLDPVLIIEPQFGFSSAMTFSAVALAATAVGGVVVGWLGTRAFTKKA